MAKITFPYAPIAIAPSESESEWKAAFRPLAIATVTTSNGESLRSAVLLDTGADACLFPLSLANLLKIDVFGLPKDLTAGVGTQSNVTYYTTLKVDLGSGVVFSARVGFTQGMDAMGLGLLGQDGFFSAFNVEFRHKDKVFVVEKNDLTQSS